MAKVRKAVIPAAGFGTRLLPAAKAIAKEMLPIINKPTIQYIVEEAVKSGIKEILIVISEGKESIKTHFGHNKLLEANLLAKKKMAMYKEVVKLSRLCKIQYVYQKKMLGLGDAISYAKDFVGNEPFAVLLGDDVVRSRGKTALAQCIEAYEKTKSVIVGVQKVKDEVVNQYGIVSPIKKTSTARRVFGLKGLVEKPSIAKAPSNYAILGRYILTPDIFDVIKATRSDKTGEVQITDALRNYLRKEPIYACVFKGARYDLGNKLGVVKAIIDFALADKDLKKDVKKFIRRKRRWWF